MFDDRCGPIDQLDRTAGAAAIEATILRRNRNADGRTTRRIEQHITTFEVSTQDASLLRGPLAETFAEIEPITRPEVTGYAPRFLVAAHEVNAGTDEKPGRESELARLHARVDS